MQSNVAIDKASQPFQFDQTTTPNSLAYLAWTSFHSQNYCKSGFLAAYLLQEAELSAWQRGASCDIARLETLLVYSLVHVGKMREAKEFVEERIRKVEGENLQSPIP